MRILGKIKDWMLTDPYQAPAPPKKRAYSDDQMQAVDRWLKSNHLKWRVEMPSKKTGMHQISWDPIATAMDLPKGQDERDLKEHMLAELFAYAQEDLATDADQKLPRSDPTYGGDRLPHLVRVVYDLRKDGILMHATSGDITLPLRLVTPHDLLPKPPKMDGFEF